MSHSAKAAVVLTDPPPTSGSSEHSPDEETCKLQVYEDIGGDSAAGTSAGAGGRAGAGAGAGAGTSSGTEAVSRVITGTTGTGAGPSTRKGAGVVLAAGSTMKEVNFGKSEVCSRETSAGQVRESDGADEEEVDDDEDQSSFYDYDPGSPDLEDGYRRRHDIVPHQSPAHSADYSPHIRLTNVGEEEVLVISPAGDSPPAPTHPHSSSASTPLTLDSSCDLVDAPPNFRRHNFRSEGRLPTSAANAATSSSSSAYHYPSSRGHTSTAVDHAYALTSLAVAAEKDRQSKEEKRVARAVMLVAGTLILMSLVLVGVTLSMSDHIDEMVRIANDNHRKANAARLELYRKQLADNQKKTMVPEVSLNSTWQQATATEGAWRGT